MIFTRSRIFSGTLRNIWCACSKPDGPEVLTVNGKAVLVVQDTAACQKLPDLIDRIEAIAGIRQGLESMHRGEGRPAADVFQDLRTKHHLLHDA